jgi:antitoxin MazE
MIKTLSRVGNSQALILDKSMLELIGVDESGEAELHIEGSRLIVSPVHDEKRRKQLDAASGKLIKRFAKTYKRLAEP